MSYADQFDKALVDAAYDAIRARIPAAAAKSRSATPKGQSGVLAQSTRWFLADRSTAAAAVLVFLSDPPQTAPYNTQKKSFGGIDYANFTNARGTTKGWFAKAFAAGAAEFRQ